VVCYKIHWRRNGDFLIMNTKDEIREQEIRLSDKAMAELLGLSHNEYLTLSHRPIEALEDINGNVLAFYIHISPNNKPHILNKLKIDRNNFVRFKPDEVYSHYA
jgi:hypothetical protein